MPKVRSHLYVPADSPRKIASAAKLNPDSVILDLEDAVAESHKSLALRNLPQSLAELSHKDVWVRINQGERGRNEVESIVSLEGVSGIWIAKTEPGEDFEYAVSAAENANLEIGVLIESAAGYLAREQLLAPNIVTRVQIGEYDLRGEIGMANPSPETDSDLNGVRTETVIAAFANGVSDLVAGVSSNFSDLDLYRSSCQHMANLGFTGRACIHPNQVQIADTVFAPSAEEISWAKSIMERFEAEIASGQGAYRDESGKMADAATIRRARHILEILS